MANVLIMVLVLVASFAIGYFLISRVPPLLHTPLMSMTNAISAVTILGALLIFSRETLSTEKLIGFVALVTASFNLVGGFVITDRMLKLIGKSRSKDTKKP
jgi:H+-translocating NAD(P) transhydrogenase subunit alpha